MFTRLVTLAVVMIPALSIAAPIPPAAPPIPDALVDLRTPEGAALVRAQWRYADANIIEVEHRLAGADLKPTGPATTANDLSPRAAGGELDSAAWTPVAPGDLETRRSRGKLSFGWYRVSFEIPALIAGVSTAGKAVIFEVVADDYSEVWVDGALVAALGRSGGGPISGYNAPQRVVVTPACSAGERHTLSVLVANGPLGDPPANYIWIRGATLEFLDAGRAVGVREAPLRVERLDPAMDRLVPPQSRLEVLADNLQFGEGPVWTPGIGGAGGGLLFSDPNTNVIHRWSRDAGLSVYRAKSGYTGPDIARYHQPGSNGLTLDPQGRLIICEHGNRRVTRLEPNGTITVLADRFDGMRLNSPNDVVCRSDGAIYFTDPPFGLPGAFDDPAKELPYSGVYCLHNGDLRMVAADLAGPNGLAFSPDEKSLYVTNWDAARKVVMRYDVAADGALSNPAVFFDMTDAPGDEALDGMKVDREGNLYVSGPDGVWVLSGAGVHLGTVHTPELPANMAFGEDGGVLYLTARSSLYRLNVGVKGVGAADRLRP